MISINTNLNVDIKDADTSEGTSDPELLVIESTRVHAEASIWGANRFFGNLEEGNKVWTSGFFLGLEDKADTWKSDSLLLARLDSKHAREWCVAIITGSTTVHEVTLDGWLGWLEAVPPSSSVWLLVQVAVHHDVLGVATGGLDNVANERKSGLRLEDLLGQSLDADLVDVFINALH